MAVKYLTARADGCYVPQWEQVAVMYMIKRTGGFHVPDREGRWLSRTVPVKEDRYSSCHLPDSGKR